MFRNKKTKESYFEDFSADMARAITRPVRLRAIDEQKAMVNKEIMKACIRGNLSVNIVCPKEPFKEVYEYLNRMGYVWKCEKFYPKEYFTLMINWRNER